MSNTLASFAAELAAGTIRVVDLTQTLSEDFPPLVLPPQFGQVAAFKMERISKYDEAGPGWYWNNFSCGEHTGTHFDAPAHWISGKDHADNTVDTIDIVSDVVCPWCYIGKRHLEASLAIIDCPQNILAFSSPPDIDALIGSLTEKIKSAALKSKLPLSSLQVSR